jgi:hypothetical protein
MKTRHRLPIAAWAAALFLPAAAASAATRCVKPAPTPSCPYASIQDAVGAALAGDVVQVGAGTYFQIVIVPPGKDGLQIVGAGKLTTILDPGPHTDPPASSGGDGITVQSRRVTIKNLTIRNGNFIGILLEAPEATVQGVNVSGANQFGIAVTAGARNARLLQNEIHNSDRGIHSFAVGTLAQSNFITGAVAGIQLQGHGGQVVANKIYNGQYGVLTSGGTTDGTVVTSNDIRHQTEAGIFLSGGAFPNVQGNKIYGVGGGIVAHCVDCFGGSIASNSVTDGAGTAILATTDGVGLVVQGNTLLRTAGGILGSGDGTDLRLNKATDVGEDLFSPCFGAVGDDNTVSRNTATRCTQAGVYVRGNRAYVDRNVVSGTFENGVTVDGSGGAFADTIVIGNKATGNAGQGVAIIGGAVDTFVSGNTASGNRLDFCDDGTATTLDGDTNSFGTSVITGGTDCLIAHSP